MLLLNPAQVVVNGAPLGGVLSIAIDRQAARTVAEWSDRGPHCVFADVPEQRTVATVRRRIDADELLDPAPGAAVRLEFAATPGPGDAHPARFAADAVLLSARTDIDPGAGDRPAAAVRTSVYLLISPDGALDPLAAPPPAP